MKKLLMLALFLFNACSLEFEHEAERVRYKFPSKWQGYYRKASGAHHTYLLDNFKVTDGHMIMKRNSYYGDNFITSIIDRVYENTSTKFSFYVEEAYDDYSHSPSGKYTFEEISATQIRVSYSIYFDTYSAVYNFSTVTF